MFAKNRGIKRSPQKNRLTGKAKSLKNFRHLKHAASFPFPPTHPKTDTHPPIHLLYLFLPPPTSSSSPSLSPPPRSPSPPPCPFDGDNGAHDGRGGPGPSPPLPSSSLLPLRREGRGHRGTRWQRRGGATPAMTRCTKRSRRGELGAGGRPDIYPGPRDIGCPHDRAGGQHRPDAIDRCCPGPSWGLFFVMLECLGE